MFADEIMCSRIVFLSGVDMHLSIIIHFFFLTLICCDDRVTRLTSSGGFVGAPSAVWTKASSDIGPWPILLNAWTTTAYSVKTSRFEIWRERMKYTKYTVVRMKINGVYFQYEN